jgi:hypothetical protein
MALAQKKFLAEGMILASPSESEIEQEGKWERHETARIHARLQTQRQEKLHALLRSKSERSRAVAALVGEDAHREIAASAIAANIDISEFEAALIEVGVEGFIAEIPTLFTIFEMSSMAHENPRNIWTATDMNDLRALSVALVYSDYVWTEKKWTHLLNRSQAVARYGTKVVSAPQDALSLLGISAVSVASDEKPEAQNW